MPRLEIPISNGFYESESKQISDQQCVNWYVNIPQVEGALSAGTLLGCPGISQNSTTGLIREKNRGAHVKAGRPYFVNGNALYRLDRSLDEQNNEVFTLVTLGTIPGSGRVSMADNGTQLMIVVPGVDGYIVNEEADPVFQRIDDTDFKASGEPQIVVFIDSFFVVSTDSKRFIKSAPNDGLDWNALDFGSAESDPDNITGLHVHKNRLYVTGSETTEEFQNAGIGGFPFQRTGFYLDKGLYAPFSIISANDTFMFIGGGTNESPAIWALAGNSVQKVSTTAIDNVLQDFSQEEIETAFAYSYAIKGAYFVGFSLPTVTFEYNTVTGKWNERRSQIVNTKGITETVRWRANSVITAYNRIFCGDSQDGRIGVISDETYTEYDRNIVRVFSTQPLSDLGNAISVSEMELTMEPGVGDLVTTNPKVTLEASRNGRTFDYNVPAEIGEVGEYERRAIWYRLGRFPRYATFLFSFSEAVKPVCIKLEARVRQLVRGN